MRLVLATIVLLSCAPLGAHDFWIEPSTFRGTELIAALRVGEHFDGELLAPSRLRIASFTIRTRSGERPLGEEPMTVDGPAVIAYRGQPTTHEISAARFARFLEEEGIRGIEHDGGMQRERFYRFAKALVNDGPIDTKFGWRFELVRAGEGFQLLYEQKPIRGVTVFALSRDGKRLSARTDAKGMVRFNLGKGVWLVKATHVVRAADATWESLWASMTFER